MNVFFGLVVLCGLIQIALVYITRTSPPDSWPQELAVYNPFWGIGIIAAGVVGLLCVW